MTGAASPNLARPRLASINTEHSIALRWEKYWAGLCAIEVQRMPQIAIPPVVPVAVFSWLEYYRHTHREAMLLCLAHGISPQLIKKHGLDDPRRTPEERTRAIIRARNRVVRRAKMLDPSKRKPGRRKNYLHPIYD